MFKRTNNWHLNIAGTVMIVDHCEYYKLVLTFDNLCFKVLLLLPTPPLSFRANYHAIEPAVIYKTVPNEPHLVCT